MDWARQLQAETRKFWGLAPLILWGLTVGVAMLPNTCSPFLSVQRWITYRSLQWRHSEHDGVSNHRHLDFFLNRLFWCTAKRTSKLRVNGLCQGNPPATGGFPHKAQSPEKCFHLMTSPYNDWGLSWGFRVTFISNVQFWSFGFTYVLA